MHVPKHDECVVEGGIAHALFPCARGISPVCICDTLSDCAEIVVPCVLVHSTSFPTVCATRSAKTLHVCLCHWIACLCSCLSFFIFKFEILTVTRVMGKISCIFPRSKPPDSSIFLVAGHSTYYDWGNRNQPVYRTRGSPQVRPKSFELLIRACTA